MRTSTSALNPQSCSSAINVSTKLSCRHFGSLPQVKLPRAWGCWPLLVDAHSRTFTHVTHLQTGRRLRYHKTTGLWTSVGPNIHSLLHLIRLNRKPPVQDECRSCILYITFCILPQTWPKWINDSSCKMFNIYWSVISFALKSICLIVLVVWFILFTFYLFRIFEHVFFSQFQCLNIRHN